MKTLGLLGGLTFEATSVYYNLINRQCRARLGPQTSAPLYLYSCNQEVMLKYAVSQQWDKFANEYIHAANALVRGGADAIVICACLAHKVADDIEARIEVPLLHIADFIGKELKARGVNKKVALLGTKVVMQGEILKDRIQNKYGVRVLVPEDEIEIEAINSGIINELTKGIVSKETKAIFLNSIQKMINRGAEGVILGSTDLGFAVREEDDVGVPLFDSGKIHATGVANWALEVD